jgi:hypothetical protein
MLAQVPSADPQMLGVVILGVGVMVWVTVQIMQAINVYRNWTAKAPPRSQKDRYVTHGQFDDYRRDQRQEMAALRTEINTKIDKLDNYTHEAFHRFGDSQQGMVTDLAYVRGWIFKTGRVPPEKDIVQ